MEKLKALERTSNDTGRLIMYHIQHGDFDKTTFYLYKTAILPGGVLQPEGIETVTKELSWLHDQILYQGFVPMKPMPEDDPRIVMTYL